MSECTLIYDRDGNRLIKSFVFKLNHAALNILLLASESIAVGCAVERKWRKYLWEPVVYNQPGPPNVKRLFHISLNYYK